MVPLNPALDPHDCAVLVMAKAPVAGLAFGVGRSLAPFRPNGPTAGPRSNSQMAAWVVAVNQTAESNRVVAVLMIFPLL